MNRPLVFDLGMHKGEDTAFYLKKGFRVIGVEAEPSLAEHCRKRFAHEVAAGALILLEGAIVPKERLSERDVTFHRNVNTGLWGTIDPEWRDRNQRLGNPSVEIAVAALDLGAILREHGTPHYMKIDIEGADRACLGFLQDRGEVPEHLSIESEKREFSELEGELATLHELGYRKFRAVQQAGIGKSSFEGLDLTGKPFTHAFEAGASGPFGSDLAHSWMSREEILIEYKWIFRIYETFGNDSPFALDPELAPIRKELSRRLKRPLPGWYDTHATL